MVTLEKDKDVSKRTTPTICTTTDEETPKDLNAESGTTTSEAYSSTLSPLFKLGENRRPAVKIVDDRGTKCLRIMGLK